MAMFQIAKKLENIRREHVSWSNKPSFGEIFKQKNEIMTVITLYHRTCPNSINHDTVYSKLRMFNECI